MAAELGPTPNQAKAMGSHLVAHPARYRVAVAAVLFLVGRCLVQDPLAGRIEGASLACVEARATAGLATEARALREQGGLYRARLLPRNSGAEFERQVIARLRDSGVAVRSLASKPALPLGPYAVAAVAVEAEGTYAGIAEFVDGVERGSALARFEHLRIVRDGDLLRLHCVLLCLMNGDG